MNSSFENSSYFSCLKILFVFLFWTCLSSSSLTAAEPLSSTSDDPFTMSSFPDNSVENNPKYLGMDNQIYTPNQKNQLDDAELEIEKMLKFREAAENMRRWLMLRAQRQLQFQTTAGKRNGGNYMCHFKLCQLGVSSGKRIWSA